MTLSSISMPAFISPALGYRIVTGLTLIAVFAAILFLGVVALELFILCVTAAIVYEFLFVAMPPYRRPGIKCWNDILKSDAALYTAALLLIPIAMICGGPSLAAGAAMILFPVLITREIWRYESYEHEEPQKEVLSALGIAGIYPLFLGTVLIAGVAAIAFVLGRESWRLYGWFVLLIILNDTGAYFVGRLLGRTKLAPRVSPNKTWEGAIGGLVLAVGLSLPLAWLLHAPIKNPALLGIAMLISVSSQIGDLAESFLKRVYNVKDMGGILPGHGGVFDRVDGYLFAGPALFLMAQAVFFV